MRERGNRCDGWQFNMLTELSCIAQEVGERMLCMLPLRCDAVMLWRGRTGGCLLLDTHMRAVLLCKHCNA